MIFGSLSLGLDLCGHFYFPCTKTGRVTSRMNDKTTSLLGAGFFRRERMMKEDSETSKKVDRNSFGFVPMTIEGTYSVVNSSGQIFINKDGSHFEITDEGKKRELGRYIG